MLKVRRRYRQVLKLRLAALRGAGRRVIMMGDFNISPAPIDSCDAGPVPQFLARSDRVLLRGLLHVGGGPFLDVFRVFHPTRQVPLQSTMRKSTYLHLSFHSNKIF